MVWSCGVVCSNFFQLKFVHAFLGSQLDPKTKIWNNFLFVIFNLCITDFVFSCKKRSLLRANFFLLEISHYGCKISKILCRFQVWRNILKIHEKANPQTIPSSKNSLQIIRAFWYYFFLVHFFWNISTILRQHRILAFVYIHIYLFQEENNSFLEGTFSTFLTPKN